MTLRQTLRALEGWFFNPISPVAMACYRILFGLLMLAQGALLAPDLKVWFSESGVLPLAAMQQLVGAGWRLDLFALLPPGDGWLYGYWASFMVAALMLTAGLATRLSAIWVFLFLVSMAHRNMLILNSGDHLLRLGAFFLIFSPAGNALSLDRRIARWRGRAPELPLASPPWAQRLLQIQLAVVYLTTALWKTDGGLWLDGSAIYYTSHMAQLARFPVPFLADQPLLFTLATWGTLALELALGMLIWFRDCRYWLLGAGICLHAGIEWSMNIPLFAAAMVSVYVLWLDPAHAEQGVGWLRRRFLRNT